MGSPRLHTRVGRITLRNPVIAAPAEHLIDSDGIRHAIEAGAGAVVVKSANESLAAKQQLQRAEYVALDAAWNPVPWTRNAPRDVTLATRSGMTPQDFDAWLEQCVVMDRLARQHETLLVASLVMADPQVAYAMGRRIEQAGLRALEFNIGTPYASQAVKGAVSTELQPSRVAELVAGLRAGIALPIWVKITGQSERVPELAEAALGAGADAVVMAGRLLGMIPDLETMRPVLGTSLGIGGFWNLPLTCHWLALSRARLGAAAPLIGINGAQDGLDVARMLLAGAHAVGIASAVMLRGPELLTESVRQLDEYLARYGTDVADIIGRAADVRRSFADMPALDDNWRRYVTARRDSR